jgi:3-deoxy-D-manno-octulosonic-acid transferase
VGELAQIYGVGEAAFVGGTLVPNGGHNPLEAAAHGRPVLFGPHMENFREIASLLTEAGGALVVSQETLESRLGEILESSQLREDMGRRGKEALLRNRGAATRTVACLEPLMRRSPWG